MVNLCPWHSFPGKTTEPGVPLVHLGSICNPAQRRQSSSSPLWAWEPLRLTMTSTSGWWVSLQITSIGGTVSLKTLVSQKEDSEMSPTLELKYKLLLAKYSTIFQVGLCRALSLAQQDTWHLQSTDMRARERPHASSVPLALVLPAWAVGRWDHLVCCVSGCFHL